MITCITPTGDRIEAFALTKKWIASQTMQPDQWLVIDDGFKVLPDNLKNSLDYVRRIPRENEGHTLTLNIKAALPYIKGEIILIIEDDDWYGPKYIETMYKYLQSHDLVGEGCARYYHVKAQKYYRVSNREHASFCQTGFTDKIKSLFEKSIDGDPYIDMRFWLRNARQYGFLFYDTKDQLKLHCSLKGLQGRAGIGSGHDAFSHYYKDDPNGECLKWWVGEENAQIYFDHVKSLSVPKRLFPANVYTPAPVHISAPSVPPPVQIRPLPPAPRKNPLPFQPINRKTLTSRRSGR